MKSEHRHPPARPEAQGQIAEERLQCAELIIDRDSNCLENAPDGRVDLVIPLTTHEGQQRRADDIRQAAGRDDGGASLLFKDCLSEDFRAGFIGVLRQDLRQSIRAHAFQELRGRSPAPRIHSKIERPFGFESETARRIINLHRGQSQIRQDHVGTVGSLGREE